MAEGLPNDAGRKRNQDRHLGHFDARKGGKVLYFVLLLLLVQVGLRTQDPTHSTHTQRERERATTWLRSLCLQVHLIS